MPSVNYRGWLWLDENADHDEADEIRVTALAREWSELHHQIEQEGFRRQSRYEDGYDDGPDLQDLYPCRNKMCDDGFLMDEDYKRITSDDGEDPVYCPDCKGEGYDREARAAADRERQIREQAPHLKMEIVERMLADLGARMMRPYEHWNEDERHMQYMEEGRFGDYSG